MRRLRKIAVVIGLILALVLVAGSVWGVVTVRSSFPTTEGTIAVPGLAANVEVRRDAYGVPTITADTTDDLFFAQGYVHAQDRFWEMDFRRHVTAGRLSELFGESQVDTDAFIRLLGWRRTAEQELTMLDPTTVGYLEALRARRERVPRRPPWLAALARVRGAGLQNSGYTVEPWTPADSVAWLKAMAWDLRGNMDREIERTLLLTVVPRAQVDALYPDYPVRDASGDRAGPARSGPGPPGPMRPRPRPTSHLYVRELLSCRSAVSSELRTIGQRLLRVSAGTGRDAAVGPVPRSLRDPADLGRRGLLHVSGIDLDPGALADRSSS